MPQSIAAATAKTRYALALAHERPQSACPGPANVRGKRHGKCGKRLGHCLFCIVLLAPALKAIPSGTNGKRSNKSQGKSEGRYDTIVSKTQQTPLDSSRNAKRPEASSITRPRRCAGASDAHERAIFFSRSFSTSSRGKLLCHRLERLTCQLRGGTCGTRGSAPHAVATESLPRPYDEGHSDLHSSTSLV